MSVLKIFTWIYTGFLFQFMLCLFFFVGLQGLSSRGQQNNSEHRSWGELKVLLLDCLYSDFGFLHPSPVLCLPDPRQLSSWSSRGSETDAVQTAGCGGQASASRRRITKFSKEAWEVGDRGDASESGLRVKKKEDPEGTTTDVSNTWQMFQVYDTGPVFQWTDGEADLDSLSGGLSLQR